MSIIKSSYKYIDNLNLKQSPVHRVYLGGPSNLLKNTNKTVSNAAYPIKKYLFDTPLIPGLIYTLTIWGKLAEGKTHWGAYSKNGNLWKCDTKLITDGVYQGNITWTADDNSDGLTIFPIPHMESWPTSTINKISLVPKTDANTSNPIWTPALSELTWNSCAVYKKPLTQNMIKESDKYVHNKLYPYTTYNFAKSPEVGKTYTCTIWGSCDEEHPFWLHNSGGTSHQAYLNKISEGIYSASFTWRDYGVTAPPLITLWVWGKDNVLQTAMATINAIKMEEGVNPYPVWSPCGSETYNLLSNSNNIISNNGYCIAKYPLMELPEEHEIYTITIWGTPAFGCWFTIYNSDAYIELASLSKIADGVYSKTFHWRSYYYGGKQANNTSLWIFVMGNRNGNNSTIEKIKLELGSNSTPVWTEYMTH